MKLEKVDVKQTDSIEELVRISKEAFDTDVTVGAQEPDEEGNVILDQCFFI